MRSMTVLTASVLGLSLVACAGNGGARDLGEVLPDDRVLVNLPDEGSSARVGEVSDFYVFTADAVHGINGLAGYVLFLVGAITSTPPSERSEDGNSATWGPYEGDALTPVTTQLWVTYDPESDTYEWGFDQKPKNDEMAEWTTVVTGHVEAGATREASRGNFQVDWTTMATIDPTQHATGLFSVEYDLGVEGVAGTATFDDVAWEDGVTRDASYVYEQVHGGSGAMDLTVTGDMGDGTLPETLDVRSRWMADGQGRADAWVSGGDLGDVVGTASECWSDMFLSVWYSDNYSGGTGLEEGDAAQCAYTDSELPTTGE